MANSRDVLVVGAGPTGLFLALWLTRAGIDVRILDRSAGPGETSRAMVVHARTLEFYAQFGFADAVVAAGLKVERVALREAGMLKGMLPFGDLGVGQSPFPFILAFPQDQHEKFLLQQLAAAGVTVERQTELVAFDQDGDGVRARLRTPAGEEDVAARYIAGCDGAHSTVRTAADIGLPGGTYAQRFYVADAEVTGEATQDSLNICLTGQDFCLVFPLRHPGSARLIGIVPPGVGADDVRFEDVASSVRRNTALEVQRVGWFATYRVHHRVSERFRKGRAFLLGDAAHLHSPVGGQNMNTGLGDAANLGWKLAAVLAGRAAPDLLTTYEPERMAFARTLVATTDRAFTLVTDTGLIGRVWRTLVLGRLLPLAFRLPRVPRVAFLFNSQIAITYRGGILNQGRAGRVHAGDRLPFVPGTIGDNFAALRTRDWQAHVYGAASADIRAAIAARDMPLHVFPFDAAAAGKGLARDALYLVRPDGHVGFADAHADPATFSGYAARWGLRGTGDPVAAPISAPSSP